jgi:hypothetical protein
MVTPGLFLTPSLYLIVIFYLQFSAWRDKLVRLTETLILFM